VRVGGLLSDYLPDYYRGQALQGLGRHAEAIEAFRTATNVIKLSDREFVDLDSRRAQSTKAEQDRLEKLSNAQKLIEFNKRTAAVAAAMILGNLDDAEREARAARALGVDNATADLLIQQIQNAKAASKPKDPPPDPTGGKGGAGGTTGGGGAGGTSGGGGAGAVPPTKPGPPPYQPTRNPGVPVAVIPEQEGIALFLAGRYEQAANLLSIIVDAGGATPRAQLFLASSRAASVLTGQAGQPVLDQERRRFASLDTSQLTADLRYISPRILQVLRGQ
jgi:tetratricopeptide (TPR) repeat protein